MNLSLKQEISFHPRALFQMHLPEYMLGDKMPDSPESLLTENQVKSQNGMSLTNHKNSLLQNVNGSLSPHPGSSGRSPSPPNPSLQSTSPQRMDNSNTSTSVKNRQTLKIKMFLATLRQIAADISAEAADKVHSLILGLVSASISLQEFQQKIQEVTNYPLKPNILPFLKNHIPILQAELLHFSHLAKQTPQQYLRYHEHTLLTNASPVTSQHPSEIFQSMTKENGKRTSPTNRGTKTLSDFEDSNSDCLPPAKRFQSSSSSPRVSPTTASHLPAGLNFRSEDNYYRDGRYDRYDRFDRDFYRPFYGGLSRDYVEEREMEDEWRNIHTMLNCILGMVEKTKRALAMLQPRSYAERAELSNWPRLNRPLDSDLDQHKKASRTPDLHYKTAEDRVADMRRRAEDAVNEVKRQAVVELHKAVTAAESKAQEVVATERLKMERLLSEVRRQAAEDAAAVVSHQEESTKNCWNCGRKARETCSACNKARYCGSFCQLKHWENHQRSCNQTSLPSTSKTSPVTEESQNPLRTCLLDVKNIKTDSL